MTVSAVVSQSLGAPHPRREEGVAQWLDGPYYYR